MEADFSGWATKAMLKCSDGRTILPDAFKHQDNMRVPLVWQHGHSDPENVLGYVILENRADGVWAEGFFNGTPKAVHTKAALEHGDFNQLSIWANQLIEKSKRVYHGVIREVSLVLAGANPGATIENVTIRHADDEEIQLEDEVIITSGFELQHSDAGSGGTGEESSGDAGSGGTGGDAGGTEGEGGSGGDAGSAGTEGESGSGGTGGDASSDGTGEGDQLEHADGEKSVKDVLATMNEEQMQVLSWMVGQALESAGSAEHDDLGNNNDTKGTDQMRHNVFETVNSDGTKGTYELTHDDIKGIVATAEKEGSLRDAVQGFALQHGIDNIDVLFPDAQALDTVPEFLQRRVEWVGKFLGRTRKSPFSRIKTINADITADEARAKGYITGSLKKEEFFSVAKRVTTPTTVYKKQKLDRDDMVDITDFDVVAWLKAEMRLMLDEEVARAGLIGDGRDIASEDKINEQMIRPIAKDHELFVTTVYVNLGDASSTHLEFVDEIVKNRSKLKGSGTPTMFTTETQIAKFMLLRDTLNRRIYKNLEELAAELRVSEIVPVEVMEEEPEILAIIVNPVDYVYGATRGGEVSMFDDFDIDYNQYKYLIETRCSGALTKLKSAMVVRSTAGTNVLVAPAAPTFDGDAVTIVNTTGVVYKNADTDAVVNAAGSPYAVAEGATMNVVATPAAGYYFETSDNDEWSFTNEG